MAELSREEVLRIARECFGDKQFSAITYESGPYEVTEPTVNLMTFVAAIYEAGAKSERAVSDRLLDALKKTVRELNGVKWLPKIGQLIAEVEAMRKEKPE